MKVLIEISEDDYRYIRNKGARIPYNHLTTSIAKGLVIENKIYAELIDKEYQYINEQEDLGMELLNALAENKALKEAIEKAKTEIEKEKADAKNNSTAYYVYIEGLMDAHETDEQIIDKYTKELL